jgi:hypothetical protein
VMSLPTRPPPCRLSISARHGRDRARPDPSWCVPRPGRTRPCRWTGRPRTGLPLSRDERASTRRHRGRVEGMAQPARTAQRVSVPMLQ